MPDETPATPEEGPAPESSLRTEPPASAAPARRRRWPPLLLLLVIVMAVAAAANVDNLRTLLQREGITSAAAPSSEDARLATLEQRLHTLEAKPESHLPQATRDEQLSFGGRVAALEAEVQRLITANVALASRVDRLVGYVAEMSGSTSESHKQVRDIALLALARHLIEQGRPLGAIADTIDKEFRPRDASAADALVAWSTAPVAATTLGHQLDEMAESEAVPTGNWWARLKDTFSGLIQIRREGAPDPDTLTKARHAMQQGELDTAVAQVEKLPVTPARDSWLTDARTLLAADAALDRLETQVLTTSEQTTVSSETANPFAPPPVNERKLPPAVL